MAPELARSLRNDSLHGWVGEYVRKVGFGKVGLSAEVFISPQLSRNHVIAWKVKAPGPYLGMRFDQMRELSTTLSF